MRFQLHLLSGQKCAPQPTYRQQEPDEDPDQGHRSGNPTIYNIYHRDPPRYTPREEEYMHSLQQGQQRHTAQQQFAATVACTNTTHRASRGPRST